MSFNHKLKIASPHRDGISIIEVLTSMAVAAIGVFGVMVMIPFAVKQSQTGLDNDAANSLGRNVVESLSINGLLLVDDNGDFPRLVVSGRADGSTDPTDPTFIQSCSGSAFGNDRAPGLMHFDPIGFADPDGPAGPSDGLTRYIVGSAGEQIPIVSASMNRGSGIDLDANGSVDLPARGTNLLPLDPLNARLPLTIREASHFCRSRDDLLHEGEVDGVSDVAPPQPIFDLDATLTNPVKRQSTGRISWSAYLVPEKSPLLATSQVNRFRAHVIVYRDRFIDLEPANRVVDRSVSAETGSCLDIYPTTMAGLGFRQSVNEVNLAVPADTEELGKGSWVMLVNCLARATTDQPYVFETGTPPVQHPAAGDGYRIQIMFAQVNRVANVDTDGDGDFDIARVMIDGGSFDFITPGIPSTATLPEAQSTQTYMVHLKDAVNVYERSIDVER